MDFNLSEEHLMIQQAARDFAQNELLPGVIERDEHSKFPTEQVKMMGELGFMGMMVDPKYGGSGLDSISYVLAMTEIAKVDASAAVIMSVNNSLVCAGMERYCNEEQKIKYCESIKGRPAPNKGAAAAIFIVSGTRNTKASSTTTK
jgi:alkylation response protein AidB-like acyl-CoA dehydrogenase